MDISAIVVWKASELFGEDYVVDVRVANRKLTEKERRQLSIYLHKGAVGEWDFDIIRGWEEDTDNLEDWGFKEYELGFEYDLDVDFTPDVSESKGFTEMSFTFTKEQMETVQEVLDFITASGVDYSDNPHQLSNSLYHLACDYFERHQEEILDAQA